MPEEMAKLLIVEDDASLAEEMNELFKAEGYMIRVICWGKEPPSESRLGVRVRRLPVDKRPSKSLIDLKTAVSI